VFHLEFAGPDGATVDHYTRNLLAPDGRLALAPPLARNEAVGTWSVRARDVLSGGAATARFLCVAPQPQ
jgi:hypothetical protein